MRKRAAIISLIASLASAQSLSPQVQPFVKVNAPVVALTHVRLIDGTGAPVRDDQTVILSKGKIESITASGSANIPKDAQVLDLHGDTVIPGLVGMHDHLSGWRRDLRRDGLQLSSTISCRWRHDDSDDRLARTLHRLGD